MSFLFRLLIFALFFTQATSLHPVLIEELENEKKEWSAFTENLFGPSLLNGVKGRGPVQEGNMKGEENFSLFSIPLDKKTKVLQNNLECVLYMPPVFVEDTKLCAVDPRLKTLVIESLVKSKNENNIEEKVESKPKKLNFKLEIEEQKKLFENKINEQNIIIEKNKKKIRELKEAIKKDFGANRNSSQESFFDEALTSIDEAGIIYNRSRFGFIKTVKEWQEQKRLVDEFLEIRNKFIGTQKKLIEEKKKAYLMLLKSVEIVKEN